MIDTMALAMSLKITADEMASAEIHIKRQLDEALRPLLAERENAVRFIRAIAKISREPVDDELEDLAKSLEAGLHMVAYR